MLPQGKRQKYFLAVRNTRFFSYLASTQLFGKLLFLSGLRQDNFIKEEMSFEGLTFHIGRCIKGCTKCTDYCPVGLKLPDEFENKYNNCIGCLYCFLVCPAKAVEFKGKLGFMAEQLRQYDDITRKVT
jgi:ferredoxin